MVVNTQFHKFYGRSFARVLSFIALFINRSLTLVVNCRRIKCPQIILTNHSSSSRTWTGVVASSAIPHQLINVNGRVIDCGLG